MNEAQSTVTPPQHAPTPAPDGGAYERCSECGAPLDAGQRYCVNCAARRGDAANPASRYFVAASRRRRTAGARPPAATGSTGRAAAVGFFALLPLAVAIGVIVGRSGASNNDADVLKALRDQQATAAAAGPATAGGGTSSNVSNTSSKGLPSDFSLDQGYTVKLSLLPVSGTDSQAAAKAESDAKSKGANDVGIINPGDFTTTPDQGQKDYVLYSGQYKQKADAQKALTKLKKSFPQAEVIAVKKSAAGGGSRSSSSSGGGGTKVVANTSHGTIHKVTGLNPTQQDVKQGTKTVNDIAHQTGQSYIQQQQQLGDITPVGGDPNSAPPLPTGGGD